MEAFFGGLYEEEFEYGSHQEEAEVLEHYTGGENYAAFAVSARSRRTLIQEERRRGYGSSASGSKRSKGQRLHSVHNGAEAVLGLGLGHGANTGAANAQTSPEVLDYTNASFLSATPNVVNNNNKSVLSYATEDVADIHERDDDSLL